MTTFVSSIQRKEGEICVISLSGYLDAHTATDLERTMQSVLNDGARRIVVDFAELEYISSAGLGVFMVFIESVRSDGGDIKLSSMKERVFSVFDLLGFQILFEIYPTIQEAEQAFPVVS